MLKQIEIKAETVDAAIAKAIAQLGLSRDDLEVEIISKEKRGFLGFGREPAHVRFSYQTSPAASTKSFVEGLLFRLGVKADVVVTEDHSSSTINFELRGDGMGAVIGRRGNTLDAIQYLASIIANRNEEEHWHVSVDSENYRQKREASLVALADKMAQKALKYQKSVALEPMNSHERRIIHAALQNNADVTTYSTGSEPNRKVIVAPAGLPRQRSNQPKSRASGQTAQEGKPSSGGHRHHRRPRRGGKKEAPKAE